MTNPKHGEMTAYVPEIGQAAFDQPWQQYEVSELGCAALRAIDEELNRVRWNVEQQHVPSPFDNSGGGEFECETFHVRPYDWGDEEQPWNLKWGDVEISWYKWSGRGTSSNVELTPNLIAKFLDECLAALRCWEDSHTETV